MTISRLRPRRESSQVALVGQPQFVAQALEGELQVGGARSASICSAPCHHRHFAVGETFRNHAARPAFPS
jgi:hypothetical protein